jgi:hypothetical protein
MDGSATVGTSLLYARQDHVHASDTSLAALAGATFTGTVAAPTINATTALEINGSAVNTKSYTDSQDSAYYADAQSYASSVASTAQSNAENYANSTFAPLTGATMSGSLNVDGTLVVVGTAAASNSGSYLIDSGYSGGPVGWSWQISITTGGGVESTGFLTYSDGRAKSDIEDITAQEAEQWIMAGRPRKYTLDGAPSTGFIAQEELQNGRGASILQSPSDDPRFAESDGWAARNHRLSKNYEHEIAYLTAALQSALTRIEALEHR